ncbi:MAG: hypothetical protein IBX44_02600 [Sulfurospirillum sp.]|nr:hypothetical protein [Sulfurospirillum sp.]
MVKEAANKETPPLISHSIEISIKNLFYKIIHKVGEISKSLADKIKKHLKTDVEDMGIMLEKNRLLHSRPQRKENYNQALRVEEMKQVAHVLDEAKDVYIDTEKENIIFAFEDIQDNTKINKIVVEPNYKVKKFGITNAILTFSKVLKEGFSKENYKEVTR